ncbi:MAG: hypothetical protein PUF30_03545 [bacterium]|nr:hypothetical protein [Parabacteroides sp.]MDD6100392.1 hypothetical protein [bacterium]MDD6766034.1 hypothetical protein [bacterium]MDD6836741.1 hypothetical protein [bacterium]MDD7631909.1 hypothetical protein [bacterium]
MAQILVTVDEDMATQSIRKAIEMIKGVVSTRIYNKEEKEMTKRQQEHYVKESLTRAWEEMKLAQASNTQLQTLDDFLGEI